MSSRAVFPFRVLHSGRGEHSTLQELLDRNRERFEVTNYEWRDADGRVHAGSRSGNSSGASFTIWYDPKEPGDGVGVVFTGIAVSQLSAVADRADMC